MNSPVTRLLLLGSAPTCSTRTSSFPADESIEGNATDFVSVSAQIEQAGKLDQILIAPEKRTRETAQALSLSGPSSPDSSLRECDYGRWIGQTLQEIEKQEPSALIAWLIDPAAAPHGGESLLQLFERINQWLTQKSAAGGRILAVTHPAVIRAAIALAIEASPRSFWRINVEPLSLTDLRFHQARWTLRSISKPT